MTVTVWGMSRKAVGVFAPTVERSAWKSCWPDWPDTAMVGSVPLVDDALGAALDDPPAGAGCAASCEGVGEAVCASTGAENGIAKASASAVASGVLFNIGFSSVEGPLSKSHATKAALE